MDILTDTNFLSLLQLVSPALPVGAYSYSEGLETLVDAGKVTNALSLQHWLEAELRYGAIQIEAAVMIRAYAAVIKGDVETLQYWNAWLSAARESEELRNSSWQMGGSLLRLLRELQPEIITIVEAVGNPCNYAVAYAIATAHEQINLEASVLGYLHSWVSNLITAGVKLIPLGQTAGQRLLWELQPLISTTAMAVQNLEDDDLSCCSWGLSLASMAHEVQYTRLFRS